MEDDLIACEASRAKMSDEVRSLGVGERTEDRHGREDARVAATKAAHANAIVAQVVRRGDCFCLRSGLPVNESIAPGFDPLQALINTAHPQGVEVHAWVIANAMWNSTTPPKDPNHIFNL